MKKNHKSGSDIQKIGVKKYIWVEEILLLEVLGRGGGGGYKLKVQGMDSCPVNECIYIFPQKVIDIPWIWINFSD